MFYLLASYIGKKAGLRCSRLPRFNYHFKVVPLVESTNLQTCPILLQHIRAYREVNVLTLATIMLLMQGKMQTFKCKCREHASLCCVKSKYCLLILHSECLSSVPAHVVYICTVHLHTSYTQMFARTT